MKNNNLKLNMISIGLLSIIGLIGCNDTEKDTNMIKKPPQSQIDVEVGVITIKANPILISNELTGRVAASLTAEVRPQIDGIIKAKLFEEGSNVKEGTVLYQLDDSISKANLQSAKAEEEKAAASWASAKLKARRSAELVKSKAISQEEYDDAVSALNQASAEVNIAKASVKNAEIQVDYTKIKAPISGRIGQSFVTPGALVTAKQTQELAIIQQLNPIYVDVTQSSKDMNNFLEQRKNTLQSENSNPVELSVSSNNNYKYKGKIKFIETVVDPTTDSFLTRIEFPNPTQVLIPGMYVKASLINEYRDKGLLVPQRGVSRDAKGNATAFIVNQDSIVESRSIDVSKTIKDQWLVNSGLKEGEKVVTEGIQKIQSGIKVQTVEKTDK